MAGPVDPEMRQQALVMVYEYLGLRPGDIIRFDCSFVSGTTHFVVRIDYAASRKGGYQLLEGDLTAKAIKAISPVLGRGRVTPRFPLKPTERVQSIEELEAEKRRRDFEAEFCPPPIDDDRV